MILPFIVRNAGICPNAVRLTLSKLRILQTSPQCVSSYQGSPSVGVADCPVRCLSSAHWRFQKDSSSSSISTTKDAVTSAPSESGDDNAHEYREQFIPMTRQSIIRYLMQEKDFLTEDEKKIFPEFSRALDRALMNQYRGVLSELNTLFDPINPDKDTIHTREFSRRERLDNEFWLLERLHEVMTRANFQELPKPTVERLLKEHTSSEGVLVSVDLNRYDVLRIWVLGHEQPHMSVPLVGRMTNAMLRRSPRDGKKYYKRVVVATRLKKDSKLILKGFKEVPTHSLEMLLPDGTIKMSTMDKGVLFSSVAMAGFGILAKVVTYLAHLQVEWTLMLASVTGLVGFRAWTMYKNRRNEYLIKVTQMLYYKNIANNRSLLAVVVDRAEDECIKQAMLTYAFLLTSQPASDRLKPTSASPKHRGLTEEELASQVEDWVENRIGLRLEFDSSEAVAMLMDLSLISERDGKLSVVPVNVAKSMLPAVPVSTLGKYGDITEGFDRDVFLETEEEYQKYDEKMKKYGWF